jgi:pimeloyl-ACP methyl ester carboxylesterase
VVDKREDSTQTTTGFAEVNGTRLYYEVAGSGRALVLMHGEPGDTRVWDDQFEPFSWHYQVVRYDRRGFGKSALPSQEGYQGYTDTEDLLALLEHLEIGRAYLIGHSAGGNLATLFAITRPETVEALVLVDAVLWGFPRSPEYEEFSAAVYKRAREAGPKAANELFRNNPVSAASRENPAVAARLDAILSEYSGWHWTYNGPWRVDPRYGDADRSPAERLEEIIAPTLIIVGDRALPFQQARADYYREHVRGAQKVVFPGVGHSVMMETPTRFNETVLSFLAGI